MTAPGRHGATPDSSEPEPLVDRAAVEAAYAVIATRIHRTPLLTSRSLSELAGVPIYLKPESLQKAGSFKARGAFHRALTLPAEQRSRGLLTYSSGNHGQAVSLVARTLGVPATIVMPEDAPAIKRTACLGYGATVEPAGFTSDDRKARAEAIEAEQGLAMIQPFDDPAIIAGQGTVGLELLQQAPEALSAVLVPIGGGGLVSGVLAAMRPGVRVIGVEPESANAMQVSLAAGERRPVQPGPTIADGLKPVRPGVRNFRHAVALGLEVVTVTDEEIRAAMRLLFERARLVVEPSGAATVAALCSGRLTLEGPVACVISGGNVDPGLFAQVLESKT